MNVQETSTLLTRGETNEWLGELPDRQISFDGKAVRDASRLRDNGADSLSLLRRRGED